MNTSMRLLFVVLVALAGCKSEKDYLKGLPKRVDAGPEELRPAPADATLLAKEQNAPRNLELVNGMLFWLNQGGRPAGEPGVFGMSESGGDVKAYMSGNPDVMAIAADAESVFWLEPQSGRVVKMPRGGGEETKLADSFGISRGLIIDADTVYWSENEAIYAVPKAGGKARVVSPADIPDVLAQDDSFIYWYSSISGNLSKAPKKGAKKPTKVYADKDHTLHTILVDGNDLFVSYGSEGKMVIQRLPKGGGEPVTIAENQQGAVDWAIDATYLYWITDDDVMKVPRGGGEVTKVVEKLSHGVSVEVDSSFVYWTDRTRVQKMAKK